MTLERGKSGEGEIEICSCEEGLKRGQIQTNVSGIRPVDFDEKYIIGFFVLSILELSLSLSLSPDLKNFQTIAPYEVLLSSMLVCIL